MSDQNEDTARPGAADQGARGAGEQAPGQLAGKDLATMSPEEIVAAQNRGQLDALLRGEAD